MMRSSQVSKVLEHGAWAGPGGATYNLGPDTK